MIHATATFRPRNDAGQFVDVRIKPGVIRGVERIQDAIYERSQELVPVDTGELKESGEKPPVEQLSKTIRAEVKYTADHAGYVEFGTGIRGSESAGAGPYPYDPNWPGMAAQPYLRPAFDEVKPQSRDIMASEVELG